MNTYINLSIALLFLVSFSSCDFKTHDSVNVNEFKKGKEAFKIKRMTDDQIVSLAYDYGDSIATLLTDSIENTAIPLCELQDIQSYLPPSLHEFVESVGIRCDTTTIQHPKELEVWQAYANGFAQFQNELQTGIQRLGSKTNYNTLVFTKPLSYQKADSTHFAMLSVILKKSEIIKNFRPKL